MNEGVWAFNRLRRGPGRADLVSAFPVNGQRVATGEWGA